MRVSASSILKCSRFSVGQPASFLQAAMHRPFAPNYQLRAPATGGKKPSLEATGPTRIGFEMARQKDSFGIRLFGR